MPFTKRRKKLEPFSLFFHEEILNDRTLSTRERFLIALIAYRDRSPRGCFASNENLATYLNCTIGTISKTIKKLETRGYIIKNVPDLSNGGRSYIRKVKKSIKREAE